MLKPPENEWIIVRAFVIGSLLLFIIQGCTNHTILDVIENLEKQIKELKRSNEQNV